MDKSLLIAWQLSISEGSNTAGSKAQASKSCTNHSYASCPAAKVSKDCCLFAIAFATKICYG